MNNCRICDDDGLNCNTCGYDPDKTSSGNSELLKAIESLEWNLSDDGGMVKALAVGCEKLNGTTSPMVSLIHAREKLAKIKKLAGF